MPDWFSKEISLGNLLTAFAMIAAFYKFHISNVRRLDKWEHRINLMWNAFKKEFDISDGDDE